MTVLIVPRGVVTDSLLDHMVGRLAALDVPIAVGDGEKPEAPVVAGWPTQPGEGEFKAYVTVATAPGVPPASREPERLSGQHAGWMLSYTLKHFGATRTQADWAADMIRAVVLGFGTEALPDEFGWSIESVIYPQLGGVQRNNAATPPEWSITEDVQIRVTRNRG